MIRRSQWISVISAVTGALLVACNGGGGSSGTNTGGSSGGGSSGGGTTTGLSLSGNVHAGQQSVIASQVTVYAAGNGTPNSNATPLACITTDANRHFAFGSPSAVDCGNSLATSFSCPSSTCPSADSQIYVVAFGGDPGLGPTNNTLPNNTALALMAMLGPYNALSASSTVNITELTTVAAVYPLGQMMGATANSGVASDVQLAGNISAKSPWLDNSVARALSLVDVAASAPGTALPASTSCPSTNEILNCRAEETINSLADALHTCVITSGPTSAACVQLFCLTTPGAAYSEGVCTPPATGAIPTNTLSSALAVALNPGAVPPDIFSTVGSGTPFGPILSATPTDWTLTLNFTGGGLSQAFGVAVDATGNVWVANTFGNGSVTELSPMGAALSPSTGFTGGGLNAPGGIAVDASGNVWVANLGPGGNSVTELSNNGTPLSPSTGFTGGGIDRPQGFSIAIDASGNVWVANANGNSISELSSSGSPLSPSTGFTGGGLNQPIGIAVDGSGNVWVSNGNSPGSVSVFNSSGTVLSPSNGITGGGLFDPFSIAIGTDGKVWTADLGNASVAELSNPSGPPLSPSTGPQNGGFVEGGLNHPMDIAIDGGGNVWVSNLADGSVTELDSTGAPLSPATGFAGNGLTGARGIAIDGSGNVWVGKESNPDSVAELIGAAVPVKTPLIGPPQSP